MIFTRREGNIYSQRVAFVFPLSYLIFVLFFVDAFYVHVIQVCLYRESSIYDRASGHLTLRCDAGFARTPYWYAGREAYVLGVDDHHAGVSMTSSPSPRSLGYTLGLRTTDLCCQ